MDNLHHLCIGFDNWTQVGFDSEDPKFSFGARQLEKGAREPVVSRQQGPPSGRFAKKIAPFSRVLTLRPPTPPPLVE